MAIANKCDRCGGYFDRSSNGYNQTMVDNSYAIGNHLKAFDICPTCMKQFMQWMDGKAEIVPVVKEAEGESHE